MILLSLTLIAVPLIEIALFVVVGGRIGLLATVAVVVVTAICGTALLRMQGLEAIAKARRAAEEGRMPIESVVDGLFLFAAGLLLLTPGFLTDAIGFLLFVPPLRRVLAAGIWRRLVASGSFTVFTTGSRAGFDADPGQPADGPRGGASNIEENVIEGEYAEIDETDGTEGKNGDNSPWRGGNGPAR